MRHVKLWIRSVGRHVMSRRLITCSGLAPAFLAVLAAFPPPPARAQEDDTIHACVNKVGGAVRLVGALETCARNENAVEWNVQGPAGPQGPPGPAVEITLSCTGDVATVHTCTADGVCVDQRYPCTPYSCDEEGTTCRGSCIENGDCSTGAQCNLQTDQCVILTYVCNDSTVVDSAGHEHSCAPYRCKAGQCQSKCFDDTDCVGGYECDTNDERCEPTS